MVVPQLPPQEFGEESQIWKEKVLLGYLRVKVRVSGFILIFGTPQGIGVW
jgi:hypothetical protein